MKYLPNEIESKWQAKWEKEKLYHFTHESAMKAQLASKKGKYYTLVELPYPSGDLHIGHWFTFAAPDVLSRYKRMQGYDVFFPMGYDAFGLPAENAAIKRGIHPKDWTMSNIESMTRQFKTMGTMIDWSKVTITCLPEYYKWNQWIFIEMFKRGIAYRSKTLSNWCPVDQTVLANEHVENGKCWRCGAEVVQKEVEQWFLKITEYADRLLWQPVHSKEKSRSAVNREPITNNHIVDWPKSVRTGQNDWIGKKDGIKINHKVAGIDLTFQTFSAYPAWSWADSFIVIAPEHPLVKKLVKGTKYEKNVLQFVDEMATQTELERKEDTEKIGIFTGRYAKDPFGGPDMPIWLANFALMNFGTGIIRCSGHDPRDVEFAAKYGIETKEVVDRVDSNIPINAHDEKGILKDSGPFTGREVGQVRQEVMDWIVKEGIGERYTNFHLHDWSVSRQRYWGTPVPIIYCDRCWEIKNQKSKIKSVYGRDYSIINGKEYAMVRVPQEQLPVTLPYDVDYTPKGKPPLASNEQWLKTTCPNCGGKALRDAETLDTFFDSSWYYYRYVDPGYTKLPFDKEKVKKLMPLDIYFGGAEHTLGHTLYARFFTRFFHDLGLVDFEEFAKKRIQHGIVLGPDGNKMSKSHGNVISPDDVVKEFGADAVRLYLSFMMPYEATGPWSTGAMYGMYRFLKRIWELIDSVIPVIRQLTEGIQDSGSVPMKMGIRSGMTKKTSMTKQDLFQMHRTIKKVGSDIESIKMNTAVAAMMEWLNYLSKKWDKGDKGGVTIEEYKTLLLLLAPFAPHMTEELWEKLTIDQLSLTIEKKKNHQSIHLQKWPVYDEKYLQADEVTIVAQVNGKVRDGIQYPVAGIKDKDEVERIARESEKVKRHLQEKTVKKVIYVEGKIINFVV